MDDITNKMTVTQNCKDRRASIMALGDAFSQAYDNILSQGKHSEQKDTFILEQSNMQATANDDGNGLTTGDSNTNHSDRNNEKIHDNFKQRTSKRHRLKLVEKHNCCVLQ